MKATKSAAVTWASRAVHAHSVYITALLVLLWGWSDRWWPATLLLFGPRWLFVTPFLVAIPLALVARGRAFLWVLLAAIAAAGPLLGGVVPWRRPCVLLAKPPLLSLRVVSYNSGGADHEELIRFVAEIDADIFILNEWFDSGSLHDRLTQGYHAKRRGGNVVLSRFPIEDSESLSSPQLEPWEQRAIRCRIQTPSGPAEVVSLHLATPRSGLEDILGRRLKGVDEMNRNTERRRFESELAAEFASRFPGPSIVAGDFNTPVESRIYRRYWAGWQNAFSHAGFGWGYTKYTRRFGVRIDHILVSSHWQVQSSWTGPDLGGDHRPVIAEITLRS